MSNTDPGPRGYSSSLREEQARQTRSRVIRAAADTFASSGYSASTIAAIARAAAVSVETVKATAPKPQLLIAAFEVTFSGSEARDSLTDTELAEGVLDLGDDVFIDAIVSRIALANGRAFALWIVLLGAALSDDTVAEHLAGILRRRRADYVAFAQELVRRGLAAPSLEVDAAADEMSFLLSPEGYQQLVDQAGWTAGRYEAWLASSVRRIAAD